MRFNGKPSAPYARDISATPTELKVVFPPNANTGKIYIDKFSKIGVWEEEFVVVE